MRGRGINIINSLVIGGNNGIGCNKPYKIAVKQNRGTEQYSNSIKKYWDETMRNIEKAGGRRIYGGFKHVSFKGDPKYLLKAVMSFAKQLYVTVIVHPDGIEINAYDPSLRKMRVIYNDAKLIGASE